MTRNEKQVVAFTSVLAAIVLTSMKLGVGLWTNSLGILSEAAHSGLDLLAAAITLVAIRMADHPPDREHNYGHGKIENFSALIETMLLLLTCVWIVYEASHRLRRGGVEIDASVWAFLTIIISIVIDFSRSRALKRVAVKYDSQALEADALHFSTDIWSSVVVLLGLASVRAGEHFGVPWMARMDSVAALGVALIVIWVSIQLARKSVNDLIDSVPAEVPRKIEEAAMVPGVVEVRQVRTRKSGPTIFADVRVVVDNCLSIERTHEIADQIEAAARTAVATADVVVHVEPRENDPEDPTIAAQVLAQRFSMTAHEIGCSDRPPRILELHLEVDRSLCLEAAHARVSDFEREFLAKRPDFGRVISHIEPAAAVKSIFPVDNDLQGLILEAANRFFQERQIPCNPHEISVGHDGHDLAISLHCALEGGISIVDAHTLSARLELYLHKKIPNLGSVTIHVEPLA